MNLLDRRSRFSRLFCTRAGRSGLWGAMVLLGMLAGCSIPPGAPQSEMFTDCVSVSDCVPLAGDCGKAISCDNGKCTFESLPQGQPAARQDPGNCAIRVCNGSGGVQYLSDLADIEDDNNPCTKDYCVGTSPRHDILNEVACYTGPEETRHVGACKDGILHCSMGQPVGDCQGAIVPVAETCATEFDDDCDGASNEGGAECTCVPGSAISCYNGSAKTLGIGQCHAGTQTCLSDGTGYGPCSGEQLPTAEVCDAALVDEDCDNESNEEGGNCNCGDGVTQPELGEACDDGNDVPTDSCVSCWLPYCGDGYWQMAAGEECEDGNADSTDGCTTSCHFPRCGDGFTQPAASEGCDDGNTNDGDDCPANCHPPVVALAAGHAHTCAVFDDGRVKCWGGNTLGQLGLGNTQSRGDDPNELGHHLPVVDLGGSVVSIAAGSAHTCALLDTGDVKCWGANQFGQLGLGDIDARGDNAGEMGLALPTVKLGAPVAAIAAGNIHSCALLASGAVKCWGYGYFGQLGRGSRDNFGSQPGDAIDAAPAINLGTGRTAMSITAGQYHTCALLDDASIKCWGYNEFGQLGQGDTAHRGDEPGEMGDALAAIPLGVGASALLVASGAGHVCATFANDTMKCWGAGHFGQLGQGDDTNRGDEPGEMDLLPAIDFGTPQKVMALSLGATHGCVKLEDGSLRCFGRGNHGQLGQGKEEWIGKAPGEMAALSPIDLGVGGGSVGLEAGADHTCAILGDGRVKCWGRNDQGQLGLGDIEARGDENDEMGASLPAVELW